jgi:uncharacterized membrane protein YeiH
MPTRLVLALAYALEMLGVAVFAISGALAGVNRGEDLFGIAVLAAVTGVGGGTLRDLLLDRHPVFWLKNPMYLYVILAAAAIAVAGHNYLPSVQQGLVVADAFGLGLVALVGAQIVEAGDRPAIVIIAVGTLSSVAGGVIRDLLSGVVPLLLRRDIYATAVISGIVIYLLLQKAGANRTWAFLTGIVSVIVIRLLAVALGWQLPVFGTSQN